jgi:transmembrane sensor
VASTATRGRPPETPRAARPGIDALLAEADAARAEGRLDDASRALASIAAEFPRDDRAPSALFTLGRIERRRGRPLDAAEAFSRCAELAPRGPLAEDALAEAARAYADGGNAARAQALAARYLATHPEGTYAARMRALLGG